MTVNDIRRVDKALKERPSRFKFVREFANPDEETRRKLVPDRLEESEGLSLDQVFLLRESPKV
jgi:hypothetical protein